MIQHLVFLLEEKSAGNMLKQIVPDIIGTNSVSVDYVCFRGKTDLRNSIEFKMKHWMLPNTYFIIMQDQDSNDCRALKAELVSLCEKSGKEHYRVRIACRELESFYFGNLAAVEQALSIPGLALKYKDKSRYRIPDTILSPAKNLEIITEGKYKKTSGSTEIGKYLLQGENKSHSFNKLVSAIREVVKPEDFP